MSLFLRGFVRYVFDLNHATPSAKQHLRQHQIGHHHNDDGIHHRFRAAFAHFQCASRRVVTMVGAHGADDRAGRRRLPPRT